MKVSTWCALPARVFMLVLSLVGAGSTLLAQEAVNLGTIGGRVTDPQSGVVPGATVTARHLETNVQAESVTDGEGRFRFPPLRIGRYEVLVKLAGFAPEMSSVALTAGGAFDLTFSLTVASLNSSVTVLSVAPVIETARTQVAATVSEAEAAALPMNGRNFLDLALLVPGVSLTNVASTQLFAETSAVPGPGLSIASQRNLSNNFIVDGLSGNDDAAALTGIPSSVDAVEQMQVVTSGAQAELGRALGGFVNVVTKSGTNVNHGSAYGFFRDDRLNASNPLIGRTLPMDQQQFGFSIGGPIVANRTFFFTNAEGRRLHQTGLTTIPDATVTAINTRLAAVGYPGAPVATGIYPNPVNSAHVIGKIDHQVSGRDQFSLRYSHYKVTSDNSRGAGGTGAPSASAGLNNIDLAVAASNTLSLTPRTVNETRAQLMYGHLQAPPTDPLGPAVSIQSVASFGTLSGSPTARVSKVVEVVDNVSHHVGAHALRAGVGFLYNDTTITYPRSIRGAYTFSSVANFLSGTYNNAGFTQTFGVNQIAQTNPNLGMFVQDEWKLPHRVTLNAGVRYDLQFLQTITTDTNNVAPRLGIAWAPDESQRTVVRASGGLFYDRVPLRALANALLSAGNTTDLANLRQTSVSLSPTQASAPVFPNILSAAVPVTLPNLTTMDRQLQNAYSRQASVELEHQLGSASTVSIGYQYLRGVNLIMSVNQNVPTCVAAGTNNGCRPNPTYGNNSQYSAAGSSSFHGMHISFVQRPASWGSYRVSYTLSKAMDNLGEFFFSSPIDPTNISRDWGRSDDDQRHRLVVNGTLQVPTQPDGGWWRRVASGLQVSSSVQYYSSLPLNITASGTSIQGTTPRPLVNGDYIARNAGEGPDFLSWNARVSRTFKTGGRARIDVLAEAFNITNRTNVVTMNGTFGSGTYPTNPSSTFGQITGVGDPRAVQLGVRIQF